MKKSLIKTDPILSIIILNYNSGQYLSKCLESIGKSKTKFAFEVIVVDNNSTDESFQKAKLVAGKLKLTLLPLSKNIGFAAGNNRGLEIIHKNSKFVLFLNPDTTVETDTIDKSIAFFLTHPQAHAATGYVTLAVTGKLQPESHRGFPTPLNTFWHFFGLGLPKLFPHFAPINGYLNNHLDYSKTQKIDACVGAYLLVRREVGDTIGWWNEKYFFYGEDLDFCYKLRQAGFNLYFYPKARITHYQGVSSGIISHSKKITKASRETRLRAAKASTNAMRIFYRENLMSQYPKPLQPLVSLGINLLEFQRVIKAKYF